MDATAIDAVVVTPLAAVAFSATNKIERICTSMVRDGGTVLMVVVVVVAPMVGGRGLQLRLHLRPAKRLFDRDAAFAACAKASARVCAIRHTRRR